jgi:hypothetical protein
MEGSRDEELGIIGSGLEFICFQEAQINLMFYPKFMFYQKDSFKDLRTERKNNVF